MLKNIGKKIHFVAILLAALSFLALVAFGTLCLIAALEEGVDDILKSTGIQGAILSYVMALIAPLCCLPLYGFGSLVTAAEKQAEDNREMKEMLRHALSEGCLSDEIARKMGAVQLKLQQAQAQAPAAPAAAMMGRPYATKAPVQRFVSEPVAPAAVTTPAPQPMAAPVAEPVAPSAEAEPEAPSLEAAPAMEPTPVQPVFEEEKAAVPQAVQAAPVEEAPAPVAQPVAPVTPITAAKPMARPIAMAPISTAQPLKPIQDSEESF